MRFPGDGCGHHRASKKMPPQGGSPAEANFQLQGPTVSSRENRRKDYARACAELQHGIDLNRETTKPPVKGALKPLQEDAWEESWKEDTTLDQPTQRDYFTFAGLETRPLPKRSFKSPGKRVGVTTGVCRVVGTVGMLLRYRNRWSKHGGCSEQDACRESGSVMPHGKVSSPSRGCFLYPLHQPH